MARSVDPAVLDGLYMAEVSVITMGLLWVLSLQKRPYKLFRPEPVNCKSNLKAFSKDCRLCATFLFRVSSSRKGLAALQHYISVPLIPDLC